MIDPIFLRTDLAGPYRAKPEQIANSLPALIQITKAKDIASLLTELGQKLAFPDHFGGNFDALYDCLCDPEITPQQTLVLVFENISEVDEAEADTLIAVLQAVSDEWRDQQRGFWSLFTQAKIDLDPLPRPNT